jgi:hypothetical protein
MTATEHDLGDEQTICPTCSYADRVGCWPNSSQGTHCAGCHRSWSGIAEAHCMVCHEHFSAPTVYDKHRKGTACMSPAAMAEAVTKAGNTVFMQVGRKDGLVWSGWRDSGDRPWEYSYECH